jgi:hypothetical protein
VVNAEVYNDDRCGDMGAVGVEGGVEKWKLRVCCWSGECRKQRNGGGGGRGVIRRRNEATPRKERQTFRYWRSSSTAVVRGSDSLKSQLMLLG